MRRAARNARHQVAVSYAYARVRHGTGIFSQLLHDAFQNIGATDVLLLVGGQRDVARVF